MILVLICLLLNTHLHILRERKETIKLLKKFLGCDLCITLGHTYIAMSEHLAHRFNRHALFKRDERGKGMSCRMENIIHLRNWKNIENKPVTGCELVDFLYFTSVAEKQFGMEY